MPLPLRAVALCLLAGLAGCAEDAGGPGGLCRVDRVAALPLQYVHGAIYAPARINGTQVLTLVDTGAETPVVTSKLVSRLGLLADLRNGTLMEGVGGQGWAQNDALVDRFEFGGYDLGLQHYAVIDANIEIPGDVPVGGMVGGRLLSHFDIDLDVAKRVMTLYEVHHCGGRFLPWSVPYASIPIDVTWGDRVRLTVKLDGRDLHAMLDSGSSTSLIDAAAAEQLGVTRETLAKDRSGKGKGAAGVDFGLTLHKFASMQIGPLHFDDPTLVVLDRSLREADMLLGLDFLRSHHVWISYHTHQLLIATPQPDQVALAAP